MNKIGHAVREIETIDSLARKKTGYNEIHPLPKLVITIVYLISVVSFGGEQLTGLLGMALYPFCIFLITGLSFRKALYRLRVVLPLVCIVGIFNPFINRTPALTIGTLVLSEGMLSFLTLMIKGLLCVLASYLLIATTTIEKICYAMRLIHIPNPIVVEVMLIYRYIAVIGREAESLTDSYSLRAPGQKGIHYKVWGTMIGRLLLRSMDRAETIYQSMCCRGYNGEFRFARVGKAEPKDWIYFCVTLSLIILLKYIPVFELIGSMFI